MWTDRVVRIPVAVSQVGVGQEREGSRFGMVLDGYGRSWGEELIVQRGRIPRENGGSALVGQILLVKTLPWRGSLRDPSTLAFRAHEMPLIADSVLKGYHTEPDFSFDSAEFKVPATPFEGAFLILNNQK